MPHKQPDREQRLGAALGKLVTVLHGSWLCMSSDELSAATRLAISSISRFFGRPGGRPLTTYLKLATACTSLALERAGKDPHKTVRELSRMTGLKEATLWKLRKEVATDW